MRRDDVDALVQGQAAQYDQCHQLAVDDRVHFRPGLEVAQFAAEQVLVAAPLGHAHDGADHFSFGPVAPG